MSKLAIREEVSLGELSGRKIFLFGSKPRSISVMSLHPRFHVPNLVQTLTCVSQLYHTFIPLFVYSVIHATNVIQEQLYFTANKVFQVLLL